MGLLKCLLAEIKKKHLKCYDMRSKQLRNSIIKKISQIYIKLYSITATEFFDLKTRQIINCKPISGNNHYVCLQYLPKNFRKSNVWKISMKCSKNKNALDHVCSEKHVSCASLCRYNILWKLLRGLWVSYILI